MCINKQNKKADKNNNQHPIKTMKSNSMMDIDIVELLNLFPENTLVRKSQLAGVGGRQWVQCCLLKSDN